MRTIRFSVFLMVALAAFGGEKTKSKEKGDPWLHLQRLVASLQQSVKNGVKDSDQATQELNKRLESLSRDVNGALNSVEHEAKPWASPAQGTATDKHVRQNVKADVRAFSQYVKSLSDSVFRQIDHTVDELQREADDM